MTYETHNQSTQVDVTLSFIFRFGFPGSVFVYKLHSTGFGTLAGLVVAFAYAALLPLIALVAWIALFAGV